MKFLKSLGIIILSLLVIFGIVLFILSKTGIITDYARSIAESEVAKLTGKNVRIEKIELGLFNHITIKNISIPVGTSFNDGGEFAFVKNVYIRFNVMDIFAGKKSIDKTLSSIVGQGAVVYVRKEGDTVNLLKFLKSFHIRSSGGAPPINKIFVEDGKVIYEDKEKNFVTSITGIKGTVVLRVAKNTVDAVDVYVNARTPDSIGRNVAVAVRYSFPQEKIRINVKADKMPLKVFGNYFAGAKEYAFTKGYLALNAVAERVKDQVIPFDIKGEAKVKDAELTSSSGITLTAQTGIAKIENNNIEITGVLFTALNGSGRIDGSINDIFNKLEYNIHILAKDIELQQPTDGLLEGGVQADVLIKGAKLSKLLAVGNLNWAEGKVAGIPTKMSAVTFDFANKKLSLKKVKGIFAEGAVEGTGYISFEKETSPSKIDFTATAVDFKLLTKNENTSGKINATGKLTGPIKSPRLEMTAFSEGMNFAAADPKKINAYAVIEKSKLTGDAVFNFRKYEALKLSTRINFIKGKLDIAEILVNTVKEKMIVGKGYYFIKEKAIGAALNYKGLDINKMNISYMTGKDMSVGGGGYLTLSGTTEALALDVYFKSDYFKTRNKDYTLKFNFNYSDNALNIKNFDFNKNLLAEASYSLSKKVFLNKAQINNLDGNVLAELTGMKFFENSILNGTVDIKKLDSGYAGNVKVGMAYSQGGYESGYLDINGDNNRFNINRVEIKQQTGLLKANGTFSVWNDTQLKTDLSGVLNDYKINDRLTINGVFVATSKVETGTKNITSVNTLKVEKILLNGKKMDETELVVKTENLYLPYFKVTSGKAYNISGAIAPDATGKKAINMDVRLDNADLYPVYTLLNLRDKPLDASSVLKGVIKIEGTLEALKLAADIYQKEGNIHISGDMTGEKKGGAYALSGMDLRYALTNISVRDFGYIMSEKFKETGKINASGTIKGSPDKVESEGNLIMTAGTIASVPFDNVDVGYTLKNKKITLIKAFLSHRNSSLLLTDSYIELRDKESFNLGLKTKMNDFVLAEKKFNGQFEFYGTVNTGKKFSVEGLLSSEDFKFQKQNFDPFVMKTDYSSDTLFLTSRKGKDKIKAEIFMGKDKLVFKEFTIKNEKNDETLNIKGVLVYGKTEEEMNLLAEFNEMSPQTVLNLLSLDQQISGSLDGNLKLTGTVKRSVYTAYFSAKNGKAAGVDFDALTGLVTVSDDWLDLSPVGNIVLTKVGKYEVKVTGKVPLAMSKEAKENMKGRTMDITANIKKGDLSILKFLSFVDDASGVTDADINIKGTVEYPEMSGKVNITDGTLKLKYMFADLEHVYANVLIKDNVIDIYSMKADTGKMGTVIIENLNEKKGGLMKNFKIGEVNWHIKNIGNQIRAVNTKYMDFVEGNADLDLTLTGPLDYPMLAGTIKLKDARITYPPDMRLEDGSEAPKPKPDEDTYIKHVTWNLKVDAGDNVTYYNYSNSNYAEVNIKTKDTPLLIRGKASDISLLGDIKVTKGTYNYVSTEFKIDELSDSKVSFDGTKLPMFNFFATAKLKRIILSDDRKGIPIDVDVNLHAYGKLGNLKFDVSSVPDIGQNRVLMLITLGVDYVDPMKKYVDESGNEIRGRREDELKKAASNAASYIINAFGSMLTKKYISDNFLKKIAPIDTIDLKVKDIVQLGNNSSASDAPGTTKTATVKAELDLGKHVTDQLYVGYNLKLLDAGTASKLNQELSFQHSLGVEYSLDPTKRVKFDWTLNPDNNPYVIQQMFIGIESRIQFESWGDKRNKSTPEITPEATKTK